MILKRLPALALALFLSACSRNATLTGMVMDGAGDTHLAGLPVEAVRANPELTVKTSTRRDGSFRLGLPAGDWLITVNPAGGRNHNPAYLPFSAPLTLTAREQQVLDTIWLAPLPPDSLAGAGYLLDRGRGYVTLPRVDVRLFATGELVLYQKDPLFYAASRPIALVTYGPTPVRLLGARPGTLVSEGMARYWKFPVEPVARARDFAAGAWRVTVWTGAPAPGRYAAFLPGAETGEYSEGLACLFAVPAPGE